MEPVPLPNKLVGGPLVEVNDASNVTGKVTTNGFAGLPKDCSHVAGPWKFNCPWCVFLIVVSTRLRRNDVPPE